ncbi:hypothetical protein C5167_035496 [Papaver somniferum]|uniref:Uncharacterized protein n=1 Tax=Papaver somniferum TaxID=3469 RepID=A0A4Y7KHG8_PAPSO|nr:hypothetical protein C5167_035496 [Papaver somniferum]
MSWEPAFFTVNEEGDRADTSKPSQQLNSITVSSRRPAILADGTYATRAAASETAISPSTLVQGSLASPVNLRSLILTGDFFLGAVVSRRDSFVKMLADKQFREAEEIKAKAQISHAQPDDLIDFYHLKSRKFIITTLYLTSW